MNPLSARNLAAKRNVRTGLQKFLVRSTLPQMITDLTASLAVLQQEQAVEHELFLKIAADRRWASWNPSGASASSGTSLTGHDIAASAGEQQVAQAHGKRRQGHAVNITAARLQVTGMLNWILLQDYSTGAESKGSPPVLELLSTNCNCGDCVSYMAWLSAEVDLHKKLIYILKKLQAIFYAEVRREWVLSRVSKSLARSHKRPV